MIQKDQQQIVEEMLQSFAEELGVSQISSASDIAIKCKVFAAQIEGIFYNQDYILKQAFPQTATEDKYLEMHGELAKKTDRKLSTPAVGGVFMGRKTPFLEDILIKIGTIISTDEESYRERITAVTTENRILKAGDLEVEVPIKTEMNGKKYNLEAGSLTVLVTPPTGIEYVRQDTFLKDGTDLEDFEVYRQRILKVKRNPERGGAPSDYEVWATSVDGVTFAKSFPVARGGGTIDILITTDSGVPSDKLVQKVQAYINEKRPTGADPLVIKPKLFMIDLDVQVIPKVGETLESIRSDIILSIKEYIQSVSIGGTIYKNAIINAIFETKKVVNAKIISFVEEEMVLKTTEVAKAGDINVHL
ncbi:baseplate J/gp47 family protein [Crassaminicella profunda]|uniref:baseplate J/gp47 family protein n=1 Tax=Crassaminicella profunda TaxID=1286698 RepID=UPI001CA71AE1|nr:baseplate J/gp47 family protein [Crassaminicella profunda]QZY56717.1 baseplate J/gp47 family protein [Crassaminicella profunda]